MSLFNRSSLLFIALSLLAVAALAAALGGLAFSLVVWLSNVPTLPQWFTPTAVALVLFSGPLCAVSGAWLMAARRRRRRQPTAAEGVLQAPQSMVSIDRRDFLRIAAVEAILGGMTAASVGYMTRGETRRLQTEEVDVPVQDLPTRLDGLRIVQLSDLHLSGTVPLEHVRRAVTVAQGLAGELIVITGDYVTDSARDATACAHELARLRAPLGVYAILGNHDYWTDRDQVAAALTAAGLNLLCNQGRPISRNGEARADFWLAGLDDVWEQQDDLDLALAGKPAGLPAVLLVHEPDYADQAAVRSADQNIILQLSGHSHGGQVRLPALGAPFLPYLGRKYPWGLYRVGNMWVYTNRGIGTNRPAVRLNCPPEITALTLRRA